MHLIMCFWEQELKFATGWATYFWAQSATSVWIKYSRSSVISRTKKTFCAWLCLMDDYTPNKVQVFNSFGGNWVILWYLRGRHTLLVCLFTPKTRPNFFFLLLMVHFDSLHAPVSLYLYAQQLSFQLYIILKFHKLAFTRPFGASHFQNMSSP